MLMVCPRSAAIPTAHPSMSRAYVISNKEKKVKGTLMVVREHGHKRSIDNAKSTVRARGWAVGVAALRGYY